MIIPALLAALLFSGNVYALDLNLNINCESVDIGMTFPDEHLPDHDYSITCQLRGEDSEGHVYLLGKRDDDGQLRKAELGGVASTFQNIAFEMVDLLQKLEGYYENASIKEAPRQIAISTRPQCIRQSPSEVHLIYHAKILSNGSAYNPANAWRVRISHPAPDMVMAICQDYSGLLQEVNGMSLYRSDLFSAR